MVLVTAVKWDLFSYRHADFLLCSGFIYPPPNCFTFSHMLLAVSSMYFTYVTSYTIEKRPPMMYVSQRTNRVPAQVYNYGDGGRIIRVISVRTAVPAIRRTADAIERPSCARVWGEYGQYSRRVGRSHHPQFRVHYRGGVHPFWGQPGEDKTYFYCQTPTKLVRIPFFVTITDNIRQNANK